MQCNILKFNPDKAQLIWMGTCQQPAIVEGQYQRDQPTRQHTSFLFECMGPGYAPGQLRVSDHVAALYRTCFFQLCQIRSIRHSLTLDAMQEDIGKRTFASRLDYCNSLHRGIGDRLHRVQNAVLRFVTGARKYDRNTSGASRNCD